MNLAAPRFPIVWIALGALSIAFHLGLIFSGLVPNLVSRPLHMALAAPWALVYVAHSRAGRLSGLLLCAAALASCAYIVLQRDMLADQYGFISGNLQIAVAIVLLVCVLEMARRSISWPLPLVALLAVLYGLFGQHVGGEFGHPGLPLGSFLGTLTISEGGIWGKLTGVSVNIVAIFVAKQRAATDAVLNAQRQLDQLKQQLTNLEGEVRTSRLDRDEQFARVLELTDQMHQAEGVRRRLEQRMQQLTEDFTAATTVLKANDLSIHTPVANIPPEVRGEVLSVSPDMIEISIGEDDGLKPGHTVVVSRSDKYLARARITRVSPDRAVGRIQYRNAPIQEGDRVQTKVEIR